MGGPINMEWKGYEAIGCYTYYVTLSYDFDLWILKVKFQKSFIIGIRGWIDIKGCESIGCWTQVVSLNFYLTHDLDLGFSRSNFNSHILGMGSSIDLEWKRCELDTMLDAQCSVWSRIWKQLVRRTSSPAKSLVLMMSQGVRNFFKQ